jgi:hypothetical protein
MKARQFFPYLLAAGIGSVLLSLAAGGSSEPTETDMFTVLSDFSPTKMLLGDLATLKEKARKTGCEYAGEDAYKCGVALKNGKGLVLKYIFIKADGKWRISP